MRKMDATGMSKTVLDFSAVSRAPSSALEELVRHLARMSARHDYEAFLKEIEAGYTGGQKKGPPQ